MTFIFKCLQESGSFSTLNPNLEIKPPPQDFRFRLINIKEKEMYWIQGNNSGAEI